MAELARPAKNITSLRRGNALPEAANDSEVVKQNEAQTDKLSTIADNLANLKPANDDGKDETRAQVMEQIRQTERQIIEQHNQTRRLDYLEDIAASSNEISAKLSVLSDRLAEKYQAANDAEIEPVSADTTSETLINHAEPEVKTEPEKVPEIVKDEKKPSNNLIEESSDVKGAPSTAQMKLIGAVDGVTTAVKTGFQKSVGVADKISGMLFKFTVSQAVNAAKIAAAIFAIILGIDILKALWAAWGDKIIAKFEEWSAKLSEWWEGFKEWSTYFSDMKFSLEGMQGDLLGIKNAWESGDWPALAASIGGAFLDGIKTLQGLFERAVTKLISTLLDKLGFKTAAKAVEAEGLQNYQNMTNNRLSEENQKKLAEEQLRREKSDGLTPTQRGVTSFLPDKFRNAIGILKDNELSQIEAEKKDQATRKGLSKEDQIKNVAAANEAREAVARVKNLADNVNPANKGQMATLDKYKKEAQAYINNDALAKTPTIKVELQRQLDSMKVAADVKKNVKPDSAAEAKETQQARNIKIAEIQKAAAQSTAAAQTVANVQQNVVKKSTSYNVHAPVTSTTAPGIFHATKVN